MQKSFDAESQEGTKCCEDQYWTDDTKYIGVILTWNEYAILGIGENKKQWLNIVMTSCLFSPCHDWTLWLLVFFLLSHNAIIFISNLRDIMLIEVAVGNEYFLSWKLIQLSN